jgi:translation initiation factor eIF-2B subunit epsilon
VIGKNVKIINSILWENVVIKDNSIIQDSLLCDDVVIGESCTIHPGCMLSLKVEVKDNTSLPEGTSAS